MIIPLPEDAEELLESRLYSEQSPVGTPFGFYEVARYRGCPYHIPHLQLEIGGYITSYV